MHSTVVHRRKGGSTAVARRKRPTLTLAWGSRHQMQGQRPRRTLLSTYLEPQLSTCQRAHRRRNSRHRLLGFSFFVGVPDESNFHGCVRNDGKTSRDEECSI